MWGIGFPGLLCWYVGFLVAGLIGREMWGGEFLSYFVVMLDFLILDLSIVDIGKSLFVFFCCYIGFLDAGLIGRRYGELNVLFYFVIILDSLIPKLLVEDVMDRVSSLTRL